MAKRKYYITRAIDYTNGAPHIGHAYEFVVADALARWHRLSGEDVHFTCGTDDHGQKIERTAKKAGESPEDFTQKHIKIFKELAEKINVDHDDFISTSEERHKEIVQKIWKQLEENGDIYKGEYEGLYCTGCEAFYLERELTEEGKCPHHDKKPEEFKEETYFFRLGKYEKDLLTLYQEHPEFMQPKHRAKEIINHVKEGLHDISVSRKSVEWGVPVPGDEDHTIYVWVDALPNYISTLGYPDGELFKKYWPADVHIVGKDINRFHTVIWPAILMSLGLELPKTVHSHGFITINGKKLSKSTGNVVDPFRLIEDYGTDAFRYYFLREVPAGEDGNYTEEAFVERANADLADGLGNLLNRVSTLVHTHFDGKWPKPAKFTQAENDLKKEADFVKEADQLIRSFTWHKAVERIWEFVRYCNKYLNFTRPWEKKDEPERLATILYSLLESLRILAITASPFIPDLARKVAEQLGQEITSLEDAEFKEDTEGSLKEPQPVFQKLEIPEKDPFSILDLKVGKILKVDEHPDADKLYVLHVDLGSEHRQLVAGIKQWYSPEDLIGNEVVVVSNLKPAKLRGVESQGMMLAAEKDEEVKLVRPEQANPGDQVFIKGIRHQNKQITIDDFFKINLTIKDGKAVYDGKHLRTQSGYCKADLPDGAKIR